MKRLDDIISEILTREGSRYTDHPADRGGPTKYGITLKTLRTVRAGATAADVETLTVTEARDIYLSVFFLAPGFDQVYYEPLQALLLDSAVNHGPNIAIKWLQESLYVRPVDGVLGEETLSALSVALNTGRSRLVYASMVAKRCQYYGNIISRDATQAVFAGGWANRLSEFIRETAVL